MVPIRYFLSLGCVLVAVDKVMGHGRLLSPPSRSSMWRLGFNTPTNYDDNALYCGGFSHHKSQDYKCGECGDPYDQERPRDNEAGGKYGRGIISRNYTQGQVITAKVEITAQHKGYFEFRICATNDPKKYATHECLNKNVLQLADGSGTRYKPILQRKTYFVDLVLPSHLTCTHCVFQWKYHAGNSWGTYENGTSCVGCGQQEEFYGCADVSVLPQGTVSPPGGDTLKPTTVSLQSLPTTDSYRVVTSSPKTTGNEKSVPITDSYELTTSSTKTGRNGPCKMYQGVGAHRNNPKIPKWCADNCNNNPPYCPETHCQCVDSVTDGPTTDATSSGDSSRCKLYQGVGAHKDNPKMSKWCDDNCNHNPPDCPKTHCKCVDSVTDGPNTNVTNFGGKSTCKQYQGFGAYTTTPNMPEWCARNCNHNPPFCPETHCICVDPFTNDPTKNLYGSSTCRQYQGVGAYKNTPNMPEWCARNCNHNPSFCPETHCKCVDPATKGPSMNATGSKQEGQKARPNTRSQTDISESESSDTVPIIKNFVKIIRDPGVAAALRDAVRPLFTTILDENKRLHDEVKMKDDIIKKLKLKVDEL